MIKAKAKGICGLINLGNTSFMNGVLQALLHTQCLVDYFLSGTYSHEINRNNPLGSGGVVCEQFAALMREMWSDTHSPINPAPFRHTLAIFAPRFLGYAQHNSADFLSFLLDALSEDLNKILKKPYISLKSYEETDNEYEAAEESWTQFLFRNLSIIVEKFVFQLKVRVVCPKCSKVYIEFDPCMYLTLPIPELSTQPQISDPSKEKNLSILDCFEAFQTPQKLTPNDAYYCANCKEFVEAEKKTELWNTPQILIVSFDRFENSGSPYEKMETPIDFPINDLDISKFVRSREFHGIKYELFAVCLHVGRLGGGHDSSLVKCENNEWYHLDDSHYSNVTEYGVKKMNGNAQILFYKRLGDGF